MSWDFFSTKKVTARKPHYCEQCRQQIAAGEVCHYGAGKFEGDFFSYYEHEDCRAAWCEVQREALEDDGSAPFLHDDYDIARSREFLTDKYPAVAARLWPAKAAA